jgi:hypothetical protein
MSTFKFRSDTRDEDTEITPTGSFRLEGSLLLDAAFEQFLTQKWHAEKPDTPVCRETILDTWQEIKKKFGSEGPRAPPYSSLDAASWEVLEVSRYVAFR